MNERMLQILQMEALTALKFAELMEVQPSSVSHILSGRNRPGFELISKIMQRMPNINPDWLINGTGAQKRDGSLDAFGYGKVMTPLIDESPLIASAPDNPMQTPSFAEHLNVVQNTAEKAIETQTPYIEPTPVVEHTMTPVFTEEPVDQPINVSSANTNHTEKVCSDTIEVQCEKKEQEIDRIVIFFKDGSFKMYNN